MIVWAEDGCSEQEVFQTELKIALFTVPTELAFSLLFSSLSFCEIDLYWQIKKTRYGGQEYPNMPSLLHCLCVVTDILSGSTIPFTEDRGLALLRDTGRN